MSLEPCLVLFVGMKDFLETASDHVGEVASAQERCVTLQPVKRLDFESEGNCLFLRRCWFGLNQGHCFPPIGSLEGFVLAEVGDRQAQGIDWDQGTGDIGSEHKKRNWRYKGSS